MRTRPRTWPSMRRRRAVQESLTSLCMPAYIPYGGIVVKDQPMHPPAAPDESATAARDPVCGMSVEPATAKHQTRHGGATYYFCCAGCRTKFEADPQRYLNKAPAGPAKRPAGAVDPVCGMAVNRATAKHKLVHDGAMYYFCSAGCRAKFEAEPKRYLDRDRPGAAPVPAPAAPTGA